MNQIYLGQRAYGFASASEIYFGKPLKDITVGEAAMLAGLPKAPSSYNPIANPERATQRQQYIIDRMFENGFITRRRAQGCARPGVDIPGAERVADPRGIRGRDGAPARLRAIRRRGLHARTECHADGRFHGPVVGLPRSQARDHGLRAAPAIQGPGRLRRPAGRSEGARRPHRRGARRPSRQRRPEGRRRAGGVAEEGGGRAAVGRHGDGHRRRPEAGDVRPVRQGRPEGADPAGRDRARDEDGQGRLDAHAAARGRGRVRRHRAGAPARSARWSAASTTARTSSTT